MKRYLNIKLSCLLLALAILSSVHVGCKKFIEVDPPSTSINSENVFSNDGGAIQVVTGFYTKLSAGTFGAGIGLNYFRLGLYADELTLFDNSDLVFQSYYRNNLLPMQNDGNWWYSYQHIAYANDAIQGIEGSNALTPAVKQQLLGECKFMRAFSYFYLVNLYGAVPMPLTTEFDVNRLLSRTPEDQVYNQIVADLQDAKSKLSEDYLAASLLAVTSEKVRPNKATAMALLARVYLYKGDYANAEAQATEIINSGKYHLKPLNEVFKSNSDETIWNLQPVYANTNNEGFNTSAGRYFILPETGPNVTDDASSTYPVYLSNAVVNSFEAGDARKATWVNSVTTTGKNTYYYAYKYQASRDQDVVTEYDVVFRLAEQYLIRAEARAHLGNKDGAIEDLNVIRSRASAKDPTTGANLLPALNNALTDVELYTAIEHERQTELFLEWGHRWLDIKRTKSFTDPSKTRADELMPGIAAAKNATWNPRAKLLPIPQEDRNKNPNLSQNTGY